MAALWRSQDHPRGLLLHEQALEEAEAWASRHPGEVSEDERDMLLACQESREHEARQRRLAAVARFLACLAALAALLALGSSMAARRQAAGLQVALQAAQGSLAQEREARERAEEAAASSRVAQEQADHEQLSAEKAMHEAKLAALAAESRALVAQAHALADHDSVLAALLALEAMTRAEGLSNAVEVVSLAGATLYHALGHPGWDVAAGPQESVGMRTTAWLSADGRAVTAGPGGQALVWDAPSGELLGELAGHEAQIIRAAWAPEGDHVATVDAHGQAIIWDTASGERVSSLDSGGLIHLAWKPDGACLATLSGLGWVSAWETASGIALWRSNPGMRAASHLEWHSDATQVVLTSEQGEKAVLDAGSGEVVFAGESISAEPTLADAAGSGAYVAYHGDGHQLLYLLSRAALTHVACSRLSRNLTLAEWARHVGAGTPWRATCPEAPHESR